MPYIPHLAEIKFKVKEDWSIKEAKTLYSNAQTFDRYHNNIEFMNCVEGMKSIPEAHIDLVIADPPFGLSFNGKEKCYNRKGENVVEGYQDINPKNYEKFSDNWIRELYRIMKDTASAYIISGHTNLIDVLSALKSSGLTLVNHIIWKYQFGVFTKRKFVTSHYHILFVVKNPKLYYFHRIEHYNLDVWEITRTYDREIPKNGTKLPLQLVEKMINFSSKPGDLIFDPFMGNGTTAEASLLNYRRYFGFEINKNMLPIYENLNNVKIGKHYIPYNERLPTARQLSKKNSTYMKAYLQYLKELNKKNNDEC